MVDVLHPIPLYLIKTSFRKFAQSENKGRLVLKTSSEKYKQVDNDK